MKRQTQFMKYLVCASVFLGATAALESSARACLAAPGCVATPSTPICDTLHGDCRSCENDVDCVVNKLDPLCAPSGALKGQCVTCLSNDDCSLPGSVCDVATGTCHGSSCGSNAECTNPKSDHCDLGVGVCVSCLVDHDCGLGLVCGVTAGISFGQCVQCTPAESAACSSEIAGAACLAAGVCGCEADSDCGAVASGRVCNAVTQVCEVGCRGALGNTCVLGEMCSSIDVQIGLCSPDARVGDAGKGATDAGVSHHAGDGGATGTHDGGAFGSGDGEAAGSHDAAASSAKDGALLGVDGSVGAGGDGGEISDDDSGARVRGEGGLSSDADGGAGSGSGARVDGSADAASTASSDTGSGSSGVAPRAGEGQTSGQSNPALGGGGCAMSPVDGAPPASIVWLLGIIPCLARRRTRQTGGSR